jgi:hypothetical protein
MRRLTSVFLFGLLSFAMSTTPARAQQSLTFQLGGFFSDGASSRASNDARTGDVLANNINAFLSLKRRDFNSPILGGEYLAGLGNYLDAGLGIAFYQQTESAPYRNFIDSEGADLHRDMKLRVTPLTATIRLIPFGRDKEIQPYVGGGLSAIAYHYREAGDFVYADGIVSEGSAISSGWATGPVILGGLRVKEYDGSWGIGGEARWQNVEGALPAGQGFYGDRIDLGGWTTLVTFNLYF